MLWSMPETIPAGMVESRPVLSVDIAATILAMANVAPAGPIDGVNVIPFLNGKNQGRIHDRVYWRMSGGKTALRQGDWKLIRSGEKQPFELYHLASDERESMDLAAAEPAILAEMIHAWMSMDSQMIESIVLGAPVEK
jgi:arylsulfatase A-like enzyme